jgi:hypothetical protein
VQLGLLAVKLRLLVVVSLVQVQAHQTMCKAKKVVLLLLAQTLVVAAVLVLRVLLGLALLVVQAVLVTM